jgi:hypothetical protein
MLASRSARILVTTGDVSPVESQQSESPEALAGLQCAPVIGPIEEKGEHWPGTHFSTARWTS